MERFTADSTEQMSSTKQTGEMFDGTKNLKTFIVTEVVNTVPIPPAPLSDEQLASLVSTIAHEVWGKVDGLEDEIHEAAEQELKNLGKGEGAFLPNRAIEKVGPAVRKLGAFATAAVVGFSAYRLGVNSLPEVGVVAGMAAGAAAAGEAVLGRRSLEGAGNRRDQARRRHVLGTRLEARDAFYNEANVPLVQEDIETRVQEWCKDDGAKEFSLLPGGSLNPDITVTPAGYNKSVAAIVAGKLTDEYLKIAIDTLSFNSKEDAEAMAARVNNDAERSALERAKAEREAAQAELEAFVAADPTVAAALQEVNNKTNALNAATLDYQSAETARNGAKTIFEEAERKFRESRLESIELAKISGTKNPLRTKPVLDAQKDMATAKTVLETATAELATAKTVLETATAELATAKTAVETAKDTVMSGASTIALRAKIQRADLESGARSRRLNSSGGGAVRAERPVTDQDLKNDAEKAAGPVPDAKISRRRLVGMAAAGAAGIFVGSVGGSISEKGSVDEGVVGSPEPTATAVVREVLVPRNESPDATGVPAT